MPVSAVFTIVAACLAAAAVGFATGWVLRLLSRRHPFLATADRRCRAPWIATLVTAAALATAPAAHAHGHVDSALRHGLLILLITSVTWLFIRVVRTAEDAAFMWLRVDIADNRRARKLRTQITVIRRAVSATLGLLGAAAVLMTFSRMRALGASLLASAGVAGIVGGLAAQSTLGNVFAGLQLAFTDALRIEDVVVVDGEWGRVESLTLTYVVVRLWDERRLVLPTTYFTTQPFQNWTRNSAQVLGSVELYVDYSTPVDDLRTEAERIIRTSSNWDHRTWGLQVTDCTERAMQIRIVASAADASKSWDLRCEIREQLLGWLAGNHPQALPALRLSHIAEPLPMP